MVIKRDGPLWGGHIQKIVKLETCHVFPISLGVYYSKNFLLIKVAKVVTDLTDFITANRFFDISNILIGLICNYRLKKNVFLTPSPHRVIYFHFVQSLRAEDFKIFLGGGKLKFSKITWVPG